MRTITEKQLHILQHSLGLDSYAQGRIYRNRFVTGPESDDFPICRSLVESGRMIDAGPIEICGGMHLFQVTEEGKKACFENSPKPPQLSRSQKRYRQFLEDDCGLSFGEWLKLRTARQYPAIHRTNSYFLS